MALVWSFAALAVCFLALPLLQNCEGVVEMSDTKKPKLSEIRAREQAVPWTVEAIAEFMKHAKTDIPHLLNLVSRMGKALEEYGDHSGACDVSNTACTCGWEEARALLEEVKK